MRLSKSSRRSIVPIAFMGVLLFAGAVLFSISAGSVAMPVRTVFRILLDAVAGTETVELPPVWRTIVLEVRLPRTVLAAITGMTLAIAGAVFQAVFRNPLADPYLMGVSSGASFGAALSMVLSWRFALGGYSPVSLAAFAGAVLATFVIYFSARVGKRAPVTLLILSGVALASILSAGTTFLLISAPSAFGTVQILGWIMGSIALAGWNDVVQTLPYLVPSLGIIGICAYILNVLQLDEDQATALGIPVERVKALLIGAASLATAAVVSVSGVIGFVGLVVPHMMRLAWGTDHRGLLPLCALYGAVLVILSDTLARTLLSPRELPLGVITAMIGVPFFLYLIRRQRREVY
jgi:iron complex transport system permease protein